VTGRDGSTRLNSARDGGRIYTRQEIARLYAQHHKGAYVGRETEWRRQEADIIAAGREGRVLGAEASGK
jgi:hypothetical protein